MLLLVHHCILTGVGTWQRQMQPLHPVHLAVKAVDLRQERQVAGGGGGVCARLGRVSGPVAVPAHKAFDQVDLKVKTVGAGTWNK